MSDLEKFRTESIRQRDEFLSIASHELRSPLTALQLQLQLVVRRFKRDLGNEPQHASLVDGVEKALEQCRLLVKLGDSMLDVAQINAGGLQLNMGETDLGPVVNEAVGRLLHKVRHAGCSMETHIARNVVGTWDAMRIEQVITNLVDNALKYAPGSRIQVSVSAHNAFAEIRVSDTGPGIDPTMHGPIFERFERGSSATTSHSWGLGLFIVRRIINAHGGSVRVESSLGTGTSFVIALPLNHSEALSPL